MHNEYCIPLHRKCLIFNLSVIKIDFTSVIGITAIFFFFFLLIKFKIAKMFDILDCADVYKV